MKTPHPFRSSVRGFFCVLLVLLWNATLAQEAKVRSHAKTNDTVWVGQRFTLVVELLAPGYFASAANFDLPDPQGILLFPPMDHPQVSGETIDGTYYTVQRHELSAYAMHAGEQSTPAIPVRFRFKRAPLDTHEISATVTTPPMPFVVKLPPGAENLGNVFSARGLKLEETWQPVPGKANVTAGTAFTRTVSFTAPDVPSMVFPPFPAGQIDGLGIYTKQQVRDQTDRGSLRGERRDVITYICERPGEFAIPAVRFIWFNLETKQLCTNDLPVRTLDVIANPALVAAAGTNSVRGLASPTVLQWGLAGLVAITLLLLLAGRSTSFHRVVAALSIPLRPRHLEKLNPTDPSQQPHQTCGGSGKI
jgi:hypothetical protein